MSSILEALRELEAHRPQATPSVTAPAEPPSPVNRAVATVGVGAIGLVIGALALLLCVWIAGLVRVTESHEGPPPGNAPRASSAAAPPPAAAGLAWLQRADPPRARVGPGAPAATERQDRAMAERPASTPAAPASAPGQLEVVAIDYAPDTARRTVTLRLDGASVVTLREHESARGIEVQLIQADGVYVRRGAEVFVLPRPR